MERFAGRFGLLKRLGKGGMSDVYLAVELESGAEYAIKRLARREEPLDPALLQREFEALSRVRHPAVVAVKELGFDLEGEPFLVMEYIPGRPADEVVRPGDWQTLAYVGARVAGGLEALHAAGVRHGDLKPANLLVVPADGGGHPRDVRIVDFGLAALLGRGGEGHRGTVGFTAPEVVRGSEPDEAADLYSLGASLYALACGRPPFEGEDATSVLRRQQAAPPSALPLEEAGAPEDLIRLVLRLLAPAPGERPRSARDARHALEALSPSARWPLIERLQSERLVGRDAELSRMERAWRRAARQARVVLLSGEAGVGKSALLDALAVRGGLEGRGVIRISGAESPEPGAAWRAVQRRLAAVARVDAASGADRGGAAAGPDRAAPSEAEQAAEVEAAAAWCRTAAARGGAVAFLVDDSDALDAVSRSAMRRLMLRGADAPALWVSARRAGPAELDEDDRLLVSAGLAEAFRLEPLSRAAMTRLVAARLQAEPPGALLDALWSRAGGHPGWTVELLRAAAASGALRDDDPGVRVDVEALAALHVESSFEAARLARVAALAPAAQRAAELLAAFASARTLAELEQVRPGIVEADLAALASAGLAARDGDGGWCLTPPALAGQLLSRIAESRRVELHRDILSAGRLGAVERFRHLRGAGDPAGALAAADEAFAGARDPALAAEAAALAEPRDAGLAATWLERAAQTHMDRGRYAAAVPLLERSLALDPSFPARGPRWGMLSTCHMRIGDLDAVARTAEGARREPLGDAALAVVITNESARLIALGRIDEARALAAEAVDRATRAGDDRALGNALLTQSNTLRLPEGVQECGVLIERARAAFVRCGYPVGEMRAVDRQGLLLTTGARFADAERTLREGIERARREHLRFPLESMLSNLGNILVRRGRWSEARDVQREGVRIALEDGRAAQMAVSFANLAVAGALLGQTRECRREALRALRLATAHNPRAVPAAQRILAQAFRIGGHPMRASRWAERAVVLAQRRHTQTDLTWARIEVARVHLLRGRLDEAERVLESALAVPERLDIAAFSICGALAGEVALRKNDPERARSRLAAVDSRLSGADSPYGAAFAEKLRAEVQFTSGAARRAVESAERALRMFGEIGAVPDRAWAALSFARSAPGGNEVPAETVARWLEIATGDFERLGDRRSRTQALTLQVELLRRHGAASYEPARERTLIARVSRLLDSMADFDELTQRAMQLAVEQLDAERGVLLLADPETGRLEPRAEHGAIDAATRQAAATYSRHAVERVAESGGSLLIGDAPTDPKIRSASVLALGLRSILCVPMFHVGRVIGAVYLDDSRRRDAFGEADRGLLEGFAQLMASAIDKSRGAEETRRANEQLVGENLSLRQEVGARFQPRGIVGRSAAIAKVLAVVERAAQVSSTVLITGENGTGKELIARVLHHSGRRRMGPFVAVNCGAIPESLLESELFGHVKGAFTGALQYRKGRFEQAHGGTLFLDEVGEMPLSQQVALLSVIANRELTPVGASKSIPVDVRIVSATNQNPLKLVGEGRFREDLYFRLNVIPIEVPPLRDRKADVPALAAHFVEKFAGLQERKVPEMSPEFLAALMQSDWPGNVRELENYVERIMAMTPGNLLLPAPLPTDLENRGESVRLSRKRKLADLVSELERRAIIEALERAGGNQSQAARELGMTEQSLRYRLKKYGSPAQRQLRRTRNNRRTG